MIRNYFLYLLIIAAFLIFPAASLAQNPVSWSLESEAKGKSLKSGEKFSAKLKAGIEGEWHLYAVEQTEGGPFPTQIKVAENLPFSIDGKTKSPAPITKFDPNFQIDTKFFQKNAEFEIPLKATSDANADDLAINVRYQVCDDRVCLPPKTVKVSFAGTDDAKKTQTANQNSEIQTPVFSGNDVPDSNSISNGEKPEKEFELVANNNPTDENLWSFLWLALSLGALSLLTPCVFPMIPITVSYFTNHAGRSRAKAVKLATIYSVGIIATFTILGMLLAIFVGAAGINLFAANPYVNLLITIIFLFFAFNLFGSYEITVPSSILSKLDGLTRSKEGEGSGIVGALLMGLTFTLTSFTCTSPFVGTILVSAANGSWKMPLVGMLAFSTVFALPFFVLALLPQYVSSLPRAGGWMNSVKVSMGFLEVAAAMKFISNVDLIWHWGIFTRSFVLAIWIALGIILAVYLLGKFQLFHDTKPERIGAVRLMSAVLSLAVSFYLLTGLFGAKLGELEAFLPPDTENNSSRFVGGESEAKKIEWIENDLDKVLAKAKAENKRVFIDFTGYTCTNCRWMEANIFTKSEVSTEMSKFVLARLYTDDGSENNNQQQQFQEQTFKTVALPFYAIVEADGKTVSTFPGLTRNSQEFVDFLRKSVKN